MNHISRCLNSKLIEICNRATQLEELNRKLVDYFPEELRGRYRVSSFTNGCLVLVTHDQVWATQLRYFIPELRDKLRSHAGIYQLASIKINIDNEPPSISIAKRSNTHVLSDTAKAIIAENGALISYEPLKQALQRLIED
jgi:hypothetical protein